MDRGSFCVLLFLVCLAAAPVARSAAVSRLVVNASEFNNATHHVGHAGVPWESCDYEASHYPYIWLVLYIYLTLVLFLGLALICDDFFVPSLEAISEKLDLSEDVAGATFMAAGSSAPELFTSVAGVGVDSDVGVGTIVGSAMFNILIIVALSAILAGKTLYLDWRPLCRDAFVYGSSIVLFIGFSWDGQLEWYEVTILLVIYICYILLMKISSSIMGLLELLTCRCCRHPEVTPQSEDTTESSRRSLQHLPIAQSGSEGAGHVASVASGHVKESSSSEGTHHEKHRFVHSNRGSLAGAISNRRRSTIDHAHTQHLHAETIPEGSILGPIPSISAGTMASTAPKEGEEEEEEEEEESKIYLIPCFPPIVAAAPDPAMVRQRCGILQFVIKWHLFIQSFPYLVLFTWSIPNCTRNRKWYVVAASFSMSVLWIAVLSFVLVTVVAKMGCILGIDELVMGLVVVAMGTSIPDAISSILVARDGFGDMAVSNAIGSNVFDINLGLGLPILIRILVDRGQAFSLLSAEQTELYNAGLYTLLPHPKFGMLLLLVLLLMLVMLGAARFRLNRLSGCSLVVLYLLFLAYAFTQDLGCLKGVYC